MLGECGGFSEFVEFEYLPKCSFFENRSDSIHSTDIRQPFSPDSLHSPTFANLFWSDSIHSTDIRQPLSPDSIHSLTFAKGLFETFCDSLRHIRTSNSPFWRIWGEWPLLRIYTTVCVKGGGGGEYVPDSNPIIKY
jgi:hypothetical protein